MGGFYRSEWVLAWCILAAGAFYRPITFWGSNTAVLSDIRKPLAVGAVALVLSGLVFAVSMRVKETPIPWALGISSLVILVFEWRRFSTLVHWLTAVGIVAATLIVMRLGTRLRQGVALLFVASFGVGATAQLILSYAQSPRDVPLIDPKPGKSATATGRVEDVLVVVVDGYPSLAVAEQLFGHDVTPLAKELVSDGYSVRSIAWSQHVRTRFSIPAIMELGPVVDIDSDTAWRGTTNLSRIVGGENLVAEGLRTAGFKYTHITNGWTGGGCTAVDRCIRGPLFDEAMFHLLGPSLFGEAMRRNQGSWYAKAAEHVYNEIIGLEPIFGDGNRDYVYAHIPLPHPPIVVDAECNVLRLSEQTLAISGSDATNRQFSQQLTCVDRLISEITDVVQPSTVVLITADHGSKTRNQMEKQPGDWDKADLAEAFSIFLAYRLPRSCDGPESPVNTLAMEAVLLCAVDLDVIAAEGHVVLGESGHRIVSGAELQAIGAQMKSETFWSSDKTLNTPLP